MICGLAAGSVSQYSFGFAGGAGSGCRPSFSQYAVSTRTAWNPHPMLEIGLPTIYHHSALVRLRASRSPCGAAGSRPAGPDTRWWIRIDGLAILGVQGNTVLP